MALFGSELAHEEAVAPADAAAANTGSFCFEHLKA
jgi:hypothetical protein